MSDGVYTRYVAIGDSQTEGLWDGDDSTGLVGFADRLAAILDGHSPGLRYANLAVRGRRIQDVLNDQLPQTLSMRPDLVSVCIGMNDVTRPGRNFERALADLDIVHERLAGSGATVLTTLFPDIAELLPVGRLIASRLRRINEAIAAAADRYDFRLVDLHHAASMSQPEMWSHDRVHGSTKAHILFAAAAAEALNLPSTNHDWAHAGPEPSPPSVVSRAYTQWLWTKNMFVPWLWREARGRSAGDGRGPKRPRLERLGSLEAEDGKRNR
jgi:lysophospholipase L1-like esterase